MHCFQMPYYVNGNFYVVFIVSFFMKLILSCIGSQEIPSTKEGVWLGLGLSEAAAASAPHAEASAQVCGQGSEPGGSPLLEPVHVALQPDGTGWGGRHRTAASDDPGDEERC